MANYRDLLSVMNNPLGLSMEDALELRNQPLSLAEQKKISIAQKLEDKKQRIAPTPEPTVSGPGVFEEGYLSGSGNTGLVDLMEASLYRAGGNLADVGKAALNEVGDNFFEKTTGFKFDDSREQGWSNPETADAMAGVAPEYRQEMQQDQDQVLRSLAQGDYLGALADTANVAFRTAADSAATVPELALGALLTRASKGAGKQFFKRKLDDAADTAKGVKNRYNKIADNIVNKVAKKSAEEIGKSSLLIADITQQQRADYIEKHGEEPSKERLAGMTLLNAATLSWTPSIMRKVYLPKIGKKGKNKADLAFKEKWKSEIKAVAERADKGMLRQLPGRVVEGAGKVLQAGGTEALQEYAQFWGEALGSQMQPDEYNNLMESALAVFAGEDETGTSNTLRALQSAFLGAGAGGATKAAITGPGVAGQSAVDLGLSTVNGIQKAARNQVAKSLDVEALNEMDAEAQTRKDANDQIIKQSAEDAEQLTKYKSIDDVKDQRLKDYITEEAGDTDLNDQEAFEKARDSAIRTLKQKTTAAYAANATNKASSVGKNAVKKAKKTATKVLESVNITEEDIDKAVESTKKFTKDTAKKIKEEYENFPQSTTLAVIEGVTEYGKNSTRKNLTRMRKLSRTAPASVLRNIAKHVEKDAPNIAAELRNIATKQKHAAQSLDQKRSKLNTSDNIATTIQRASSTGKVPNTAAPQVVADIIDTSRNEFDSKESLNTVRNALNAVRNTDYYKSLQGNRKKVLENLDARLNEYEAELNKSVSEKAQKAVKKTAETVKETTGKVRGLFSSKKDKDSDTELEPETKSVLEKLDNAFTRYANKLKEKQTSQEEMPVTEIKVTKKSKDGDKELLGTVKANKELEVFTGALEASDKQAKNNPDLVDNIIGGMASPAFAKLAIQGLDTADPDIIEAFLRNKAPNIFEADTDGKVRKTIENALKSLQDAATEDVAEPGEVDIDLTDAQKRSRTEFDRLTDEQKSKLKVIKLDEDADTSGKFDNKVIYVQEDEGMGYSFYAVPPSEEDLQTVQEFITVCK